MCEVKGYYASIKAGKRWGVLAGPCRTHEEALALVDRAHAVATKCNPVQSAFAGFGTLSITIDEPATAFQPGVLNELLGLARDAEGWLAVPRILVIDWLLQPDQAQRDRQDDARKVYEYVYLRRRHSGCRGHLKSKEFQARFPEINNQEDFDVW